MKLPRGRGIIVSTEMILLLTAVIMLAIVAFFGMSKMVLNQATSKKITLVVVRAEAWKITDGVAISVYVQNTGSQAVSITSYGVRYSAFGTIYNCYATTSLTINPGESKVLSTALGSNSGSGNCGYLWDIDPGDVIYVYVKAGNNEVGTAVKVASPS